MSIRLIAARARLAVLAALVVSSPLLAQGPTSTPGTGGTQPAQPAQTQALPPATPGLNFSGVIFGSWNYQMLTTPNQLRNQNNNEFVVDRAYLTFRMPAGDHTSIRITTDVFRSTDSTSNAYTIRAKYAFLQYESSKFSNGLVVAGKIGIIENVVIPYLENFWPRYLSQAAIERSGYFSSADVGLGSIVTFPNKMGEIYATVVNGPGYTTRERDRFKDFAIRLTYTPLMNKPAGSLLQTFSVSAWGYKGALPSAFVNGGAGQLGAVGEALDGAAPDCSSASVTRGSCSAASGRGGTTGERRGSTRWRRRAARRRPRGICCPASRWCDPSPSPTRTTSRPSAWCSATTTCRRP